jgi:glucose/arabinose dehydrogenase
MVHVLVLDLKLSNINHIISFILVIGVKRNLILLAVVIIVILAGIGFYILTEQNPQNGTTTEVLADNLEIPWAIDFLPDGKMIFTERPGRVSVLDGDQVKIVGKINTTASGESGLLGIAVDPNFTQNHYIYLYYTKGNMNRVSRYVLGDQLENETVILDNIPAAQVHDGGRIKFGPDGKLYVTTGDAQNSQSTQDVNTLNGKILRLNSDGSIPSDNPFGNYVYSYGHRNPQGIAWGNNGIMYESEHGQTANDEINIIKKGSNYGWPTQQGNVTVPGITSPLRAYTEFTLAPSGLAFYNNTLYVAGLRGNQLRKLTLAADGKSILNEEAILGNLGRIREVVEHDGYLYISTSNRDGRGLPQNGDDKIIRIKI